MAWGLGNFLTDLVGQSNIDAAKNAYNNSRFKGTVDNVSAGLGDVQDYTAKKARELEAYRQGNIASGRNIITETVDDIKDYYSDTNRAARAEQERGLNYFQADPSKQALTDTSADVVLGGLGAIKGLNSAKAVTNVTPVAQATEPTNVIEDVAAMVKMDVPKHSFTKASDAKRANSIATGVARAKAVAKDRAIEEAAKAKRAQEFADYFNSSVKDKDTYGTLF